MMFDYVAQAKEKLEGELAPHMSGKPSSASVDETLAHGRLRDLKPTNNVPTTI